MKFYFKEALHTVQFSRMTFSARKEADDNEAHYIAFVILIQNNPLLTYEILLETKIEKHSLAKKF